jgi:hypothetical protein
MEKQQKDELLTRIARHLMLQSSVIERTGLLDGKMGMAIFFFHYSRYNGSTILFSTSEHCGNALENIEGKMDQTSRLREY